MIGFNLKKYYCHFILIVLFFISPHLTAQSVNERFEKKDQQDRRLPLKSVFDRDDLTSQPLADTDLLFDMQALETSIDPNTYIVGPGDQFLINIWSTMEANFKTAVTPEGKLIIPTIGTLVVDGKTLIEVQKMVREAGDKKYLQSKINANLIMLRTFRVHVTGQVHNPGPYAALAVYRVSDIIEQAGGLTTWGFERAIQVRHSDGVVDKIDLHQYKKLGNLDANIYLKGGDVIFVPAIDLTQATVRVDGRVNDPGIYEIAENETLKDLLLRVDALNRRVDLRNAYIERTSAGNSAVEIIPIFPYLENKGNGYTDFYLNDGDVIILPQRNEDVYVIGAVRNPGAYPFIPKLKVQDYVGFAGSTENGVHLTKCKVIRYGSQIQEKGADLLVEPGDTVFVPRRTEFGVNEITSIVATIMSVIISMKAVGVL